MSLFNSPLLLGFDQFERTLDRIAKAGQEGYPPYNVEQIGDDRLRITLAVAGFRAQDIDIQVEDNQLTIRGQQPDDAERVFLHRGIAARQFVRSFVLAEGLEVAEAGLDNGLLSIGLKRVKSSPKVRSIPISSSGTAAGETAQKTENAT
jgi:HSP20 family molecular chaperone IbpA